MAWETFLALSDEEEAALFAAARRINEDRDRAARKR